MIEWIGGAYTVKKIKELFESWPREREYELPSATAFLAIAFVDGLIPFGRNKWLFFTLAVIAAVCAAVHDYKADDEFSEQSVLCLIGCAVCIAGFLYFALK